MKNVFVALALGLTACASTAPAAHADELDWISGCWRNEARTYREVWTKPEYGYLFGYALNLEGDVATYFEQTRITLGTPATFDAYPAGFGPSEFTEESRGKESITFVNPAHNFPQRITYARDGRRMKATISLMNGDRAQVFEFRRC